MPGQIHVLPNGQQICLVDRDQLLFAGKRQMRYSAAFPGFVAQPTPPATFDWSKGRTIKFPILGNDRYGDCFYAAVAHGSQCFNGMNGRAVTYDLAALESRYLKLSGGDNGLDDGTIMPEWKTGIVGPNGPHKIVGDIQVDPSDDQAIALAMWAFSGLIWTAQLLNGWLRTQPGDTWTNNSPMGRGGHAMWLTGRNATGWQVETWGMDPPITVTSAGMRAARPELLACFSMEMFSDAGFAPCGLHYLDLAPLWKSIGGGDLPASPFPAPAPEVLTYIPGG